MMSLGIIACAGVASLASAEIIRTIVSKKGVVEKKQEDKIALYKDYPVIYSEKHENGLQLASGYYLQNNKTYKDALYLNTAIIGAPSVGKATRVMYPNLLNPKLRGTIIVNDPKADLYRDTAKIQEAMGRKVIKISFDDIKDKVNVLAEIDGEENIFQFSKSILISSASSDGASISSDTMSWINLSTPLLTSLFLFVKDYQSKNPGGKFDNITEALCLLKYSKDDDQLEDIIKPCKKAYKYFLSYKNGKHQDNIKTNINNLLAIYLSDRISEVTSETTLNLNEIRKKEHIIYLCGNTVSSKASASVISPILQMLINKCRELGPRTTNTDKKNEKILDVHFLLDEFGNMGKIEGLNEYLTMFRPARINFCMVLHSYSQLHSTYGIAEVGSITSGIAHTLFLKINNDIETLDNLVERGAEIKREYVESEYDKNGVLVKTKSSYINESTISPREARSIKVGEGYLFSGSEDVMKIKFNAYYEENRYSEYLKSIEESRRMPSAKESVINITTESSKILDNYNNSKENKIPCSYEKKYNEKHSYLKEVAIAKDSNECKSLNTQVAKINQNQELVSKYKKYIDKNFK